MKNTPTDDRLALIKILARFGGRFLCRSPPAAGGGPPPQRRPAKGAGPGGAREFFSRWWMKRSRWRGAVRQAVAILFCLMVALIILTDPLCATVQAAGRRLRRLRPEKPTSTMTATVTPKENAP